MAIIEEIPGLEVRILVDRRPLQEYPQTPDESDDSEQQATRYIVAEPGKEFKVEVVRKQTFRMGAPKWDVACWTKIDGKEVRGSFIRKTDLEYITKVMDSVDVDMGKGKWGSTKFMFSELAFDNTEAVPSSTKQVEEAKAMGEIKITFKRGTVGASLPPSMCAGQNFKATGKVHEKALKGRAMSRTAGLAEIKANTAPTVFSFDQHDTTPFATFKFLYRSMQDLKSEMIIPRSPSPTPLDELPDSELTREQLLERLEESRAVNARIKAEGQRIKRERSRTVVGGEEDEDEDGSDGIEVVAPPPKRAKVIESIDLTGD